MSREICGRVWPAGFDMPNMPTCFLPPKHDGVCGRCPSDLFDLLDHHHTTGEPVRVGTGVRDPDDSEVARSSALEQVDVLSDARDAVHVFQWGERGKPRANALGRDRRHRGVQADDALHGPTLGNDGDAGQQRGGR